MRRLLPFILGLVGLLAGGGAGFLLRSPPVDTPVPDPCGQAADESATVSSGTGGRAAGAAEEAVDPAHPDVAATHEYVKLNNQFVVPVIENGEVAALVILSISLEVVAGATEQVYAREPKLRDQFLQVLFDHANMGGFRGAFTQSNNMEILRNALIEAARKSLGPAVTDVLIVDIVRQVS
ncbi:MAG: flagellar basal body-associated FliL family protein [Albidovulum sp.]